MSCSHVYSALETREKHEEEGTWLKWPVVAPLTHKHSTQEIHLLHQWRITATTIEFLGFKKTSKLWTFLALDKRKLGKACFSLSFLPHVSNNFWTLFCRKSFGPIFNPLLWICLTYCCKSDPGFENVLVGSKPHCPLIAQIC